MRHVPSAAALAAALVLALSGSPALADGGVPVPEPSMRTELTPEQRADQHYNRGVRLRAKAWELEEKAASATGPERDKLQKKAEKSYRGAIRAYREAVEADPRHYRSHSDLGYALRKVGEYEEALQAYDTALSIMPPYAEAIEYRAEAYLALGRIEEAKQAYLHLFANDPTQADTLMEAMSSWVERHRSEPGEHDPAAVEGFAEWVAERQALAGQTAALREVDGRRW